MWVRTARTPPGAQVCGYNIYRLSTERKTKEIVPDLIIRVAVRVAFILSSRTSERYAAEERKNYPEATAQGLAFYYVTPEIFCERTETFSDMSVIPNNFYLSPVLQHLQ